MEKDRKKPRIKRKVSQHALLGQRAKKPFNFNKNFRRNRGRDKNCTFNEKRFICKAEGDKKMECLLKSERQTNVVEKEEKEEEDNITFITEVKRNSVGDNNDKDYEVLSNIQEKNMSKNFKIDL